MLKTINYRGGVVRFRIPADWVEEYEDAGGGTFYKPGDDTGTLRLNVLAGTAPPGKLAAAAYLAEQFAGVAAKYGVVPEPLGGSAVMVRYTLPAEERGQSLKIRTWRIFQALPPSNFRHALFTYTLLADQFDHPGSVAEMELLDREIAALELAPVVGQTPPASKKPWWRPW
ncbi:MAG: hypothetical protein WBL63_22335 [Candidatus Acidiferrum sp.]